MFFNLAIIQRVRDLLLVFAAAAVCVLALPSVMLAGADAQNRGYYVQPGDSLSVIADVAGVSVEQLMDLNGIDNADSIVIGQLLLLPPGITVEQDLPDSADAEVNRPEASFI